MKILKKKTAQISCVRFEYTISSAKVLTFLVWFENATVHTQKL